MIAMRRTGVLGFIGQVAAWLVILALAAVLAVAVLVPRLGDATPYTVLTGSMEPTYPPGTLVVVKSVDPEEIHAGEVVTFQLESGESAVATHRVVEVSHELDGDVLFRTKGDANDAVDAEPVRPAQLKGRVWYSVPYLGHANDVLTGSQRQIAVYAAASLLMGYAAFMFTGSLRERSRSREEAETDEEIRVG